MPKAVRFRNYGGLDVLKIEDVDKPKVKDNEVLVRVKTAGINPGEAKIREGLMHNVFPATFPSGEGTDFAGIVEETGPDVTMFNTGDEVAGYTHKRGSHAEYVLVKEDNLVLKPKTVSWKVAGSLFVVGTTAYAATKAVNLKKGDKVIVSGAAGGVGSIAAQLSRYEGAKVYGIASDHDHQWLRSLDITPISYSGNVMDNIKSVVKKPDAFIDSVGKGYVKMAIDLGIKPDRINTIIDFGAAQEYGVKTDGSSVASSASVLKELLDMVASGTLELPIAKTFSLAQVKEAYDFLETEHHRGKAVLIVS